MPSRGLTSGEEGGGEDASDDVCTEMDADMACGGIDVGCCWLERRYLCLAWGLAFGVCCGIPTTISTSSSESSASAGSRGGATRRCLRGLVVEVYTWRHFPFCVRRLHVGSHACNCLRLSAHERACGGVSSAMWRRPPRYHCRPKTPCVCPSAVVACCH